MTTFCCRTPSDFSILPEGGQWALPPYTTVLNRSEFSVVIREALGAGLATQINTAYATNNTAALVVTLGALATALTTPALLGAPAAIQNSSAVSVSVWFPNGTTDLALGGTDNVAANVSVLSTTYSEGIAPGPIGTTTQNLYINLKLQGWILVVAASLTADPLFVPCEDAGDDNCPVDDDDDGDCEDEECNVFLPQICTVQWRLA
jgi:hypothetical protein